MKAKSLCLRGEFQKNTSVLISLLNAPTGFVGWVRGYLKELDEEAALKRS